MENIPLDKKTAFNYVIIFIITLYFMSMIDIKLNILYATLIAIVIIYLLFTKQMELKKQELTISNEQYKSIIPKIENKNKDIVEFLFSIQDFYTYNPLAYAEMVNEIEHFFTLYEETHNNPKFSGRNYELMNEHKRLALNALHSLIFTIPSNKEYTNKLNDSFNILDKILMKHMNEVEKLAKEYVHENGYNVDIRLINKGMTPYNYYNDKLYTNIV